MTDDRIERLRGRLEALLDQTRRHTEVLDAIEADPNDYDSDNVDNYLEALDDSVSELDFLADATAAIDPLESTAEAAQAEFMEGARVLVDDHEIEGLRLVEFDPPEAALMVPSPKVNQIRGGRQTLVMPDGSEYAFSIEQTLVADVDEDKSGDLKLVLELRE